MQSGVDALRMREMRKASVFRSVFVQLAGPSGLGLSTRELAVLLVCVTQPEKPTISSLSVHLRISKPAVVRAVDRLAEANFVKRTPDIGDRRSVHIIPLPAGQMFVANMFASHLLDIKPKQASDG